MKIYSQRRQTSSLFPKLWFLLLLFDAEPQYPTYVWLRVAVRVASLTSYFCSTWALHPSYFFFFFQFVTSFPETPSCTFLLQSVDIALLHVLRGNPRKKKLYVPRKVIIKINFFTYMFIYVVLNAFDYFRTFANSLFGTFVRTSTVAQSCRRRRRRRRLRADRIVVLVLFCCCSRLRKQYNGKFVLLKKGVKLLPVPQ